MSSVLFIGIGQIEAFTDGILEVMTRHAASIFRAIPESDHDSQSETQILNARDHSIVPSLRSTYCRTQLVVALSRHKVLRERREASSTPSQLSRIGKNLSALNGLCDIDAHFMCIF